MTHKTNLIALCCAVVMAAPAVADDGGYRAVPMVGTNTFEMLLPAELDPSQVWCEAGKHATRLGAGPADRLYLTHGFGPSATTRARNAAGFSLVQPEENEVQPGFFSAGRGFLTVRRRGANLGVGHTRSMCKSHIGL